MMEEWRTMIADNRERIDQHFAGGDADFKDVYVGMKKLPYVGGIRVGQFNRERFQKAFYRNGESLSVLRQKLIRKK